MKAIALSLCIALGGVCSSDVPEKQHTVISKPYKQHKGIPSSLQGALRDVRKVATIRITSTCRSKGHNRKVGGAKNSYHLSCRAVDFSIVKGSKSKVLRLLRNNRNVGGIGVYRGHIHIDNGPRRYW